MKFIDFIYTQQATTVITTSSQNPNFPSSNIRHQFRSKEWRSSGNFVVVATNNKIDFQEAYGDTITATIPSATYTAATLAAAIVTAMNAVGTAIYSCFQSGQTGIWTISSSGTYLSLVNLTGANHTNSLLVNSLGFAASDATGSLSYNGARCAIHTEEWACFDLVTTTPIDTVALLWPKENGIILSSSAVVTLQASATNVWTAPAVSMTMTVDNTYSIASTFFTTDQNYRYWRIKIVDPANVNLFVNLGVVVLGKDIGIQPPENGFTFQNSDQSVVTATPYGHQYVDEYPLTAEMVFNYNYMTYSDALLLDNAFRRNGIKTPVFVALDDQGVVFNSNHLSIYGKFTTANPFLLTHVSRNYLNSTVTIDEIS